MQFYAYLFILTRPSIRTSCDDPFPPQILNLLATQPSHVPEYFIRMLSQERRWAPNTRLSIGILDRRADDFDGATRWMVDGLDHATSAHYNTIRSRYSQVNDSNITSTYHAHD